MKKDPVEQNAQFIKHASENREKELRIIEKSKAKLSFNGKYVFVIKYFPDYPAKSTQIFVPKGKVEQKVVQHFIDKRNASKNGGHIWS
jgi:hypothetical protein